MKVYWTLFLQSFKNSQKLELNDSDILTWARRIQRKCISNPSQSNGALELQTPPRQHICAQFCQNWFRLMILTQEICLYFSYNADKYI